MKILGLAGVKDVWSETRGHTKSGINLFIACFKALMKLSEVRVPHGYDKMAGIVEGALE